MLANTFLLLIEMINLLHLFTGKQEIEKFQKEECIDIDWKVIKTKIMNERNMYQNKMKKWYKAISQ